MDKNLSEQIFKLFQVPFPLYMKFPRIKKKKNRKPKIRWIYAPNEKLKELQRQILNIVLYRYAAHPCAHAYVAQKNIRSGASCHTKYDYTIVLDIKEFFPSITSEQIKKALRFYIEQKPNIDPVEFFSFSWDDRESFLKALERANLPATVTALDILVELCTHEGVLPQGAPTSGAISNIIMYPLDTLFEQICVERDFSYTRYADDLTFSGNDLEALKTFVFGYVFRKINEAGFIINKKKVHVLQGEHRFVTGLNVHKEGVRPARKYRRKLRAKLAHIRKDFQDCKDVEELYLVLKKHANLRRVIGHLWYISYTDTYSSSVEKLVLSYFIPIAECFQKFFPSFSTEVSEQAFYKTLSASLRSRFKTTLMSLHKEFRKMKITGIEELRSKGLSTERMSIGGSINHICKSELCTYREKRDSLSNLLAYPDFNWNVFTVATFQKTFKIASPEDKLKLLLVVIKSTNRTRGIWYKTCLYASRLPYKDRLAALEAINESKSFLIGTSAMENITFRVSIRKIMRGLSLADLSVFATSDNSSLRLAAQDIIRFRNEEQDKPREERSTSLQ